MELELNKVVFDTYQMLGELMVSQEETAETIVPDYCPDIARIIQTDSKVFLHHHEIRDGKAEISGVMRINVLYVPDGEHGVRALEFAIPFSAENDNRMLADCHYMTCEAEPEFQETRMLNPRKLFTRCKVLLRITGYRKGALEFAADVETKEEYLLEKRCEQQTAMLLTQVSEKDFTFSGEMNVSPGRTGAAEILGNQISWSITEKKIVGSKLIFKGMIFLNLLYRSMEGECCSASAELPFSQIMEIDAAAENAEVSLRMQLTGTDIQIDGGDPEGRGFAVMLYFRGSALLREKRELTLLNDLYSTAYEVNFNADPLLVTEYREILNRKQIVREVLEVGASPETMLAASVKCGSVSVSREEEKSTLRVMAEIKVLYLGEGGVPLLAERNVSISAQTDIPADCAVKARAVCLEEVQGSLGEHGIEVRFTVDFIIEMEKQVKRVCVNHVKLNLESGKNLAGTPSLILRYIGKHECGWDLAKKYNTTIREILAANQLEEEPLPTEKLLLIPRKRS